MKLSALKSKLTLAAAGVLAGVITLAAPVAAIPYSGSTTPSMDHPAFNVYTGVPSVGDESDFLRGKVSTETGYVNDVASSCANNTEFTLRVYVHNGASETLNDGGNGTGVARDTKVKVHLPTSSMSKFSFNSTISSSNAGSMTDGMSINCGNKVVKLSYIAGTAQQFSQIGSPKTQALSDSIVTTGAKIGSVTPNGDVWGCWDQRVWVTLKVKVTDLPKEEPKPSTGVCKAIGLEVHKDRRAEVQVNAEVNNAEIIGYRVDFGDGTVVNERNAAHTYAKDGNYIITGYVQVKYADGRTEWKTADDCKKQVTFTSEEPPKVTPPPTTTVKTPPFLPKTGAGAVVASVMGASMLGGGIHYALQNRRIRG